MIITKRSLPIIYAAIIAVLIAFLPMQAEASAVNHLNREEKILYDALYRQAADIASGTSNVTKFRFIFLADEERTIDPLEEKEINMSGSLIGFDAQQLGLTSLFMTSVSGKNYVSSDAKYALERKIDEMSNRLLLALIEECPMELYWFNKQDGLQMKYQYVQSESAGKSQLILSEISCSLTVDPQYAEGSSYRTDVMKIKNASAAIDHAKQIVTEAAGKSDRDKLLYYKDCILKLADYHPSPEASGNAYEIIWLFDGNPDTKVVCEAYAKAFQYLCNLSVFSDAECKTIYGTVKFPEENAASSPLYTHAWNLIRLGGKNYLVDLTNCDAGTIGDPDLLYLASQCGGSVKNGYTFYVPQNGDVTYFYNSDYLAFFSEAELSVTQHIHVAEKAVENDTAGNYYLVEFCKDCQKELSRTKMEDSAPPDGYEYEEEEETSSPIDDELENESFSPTDNADENETFSPVDNDNDNEAFSPAAPEDNRNNESNQNLSDKEEPLSTTGHWVTDALPLRKKQKFTAVLLCDLSTDDYVEAYETTNPKIVKISGKANGEVCLKAGNKKGTAFVSAKLHSGIVQRMKITVQSKAVKTKKISIEIPATTLSVGQTMTIRTTLFPLTSTQKVSFQSKKKSVLSVNKKGVVTAKKPGATQILIKSGSVKKKINVKVTRE